MGLNYGEAERQDRPAAVGGPRGRRGNGGWFARMKGKRSSGGGGGGRRGGVLGGRISVDSMKLKYEEGWGAEAVSAENLLRSEVKYAGHFCCCC